MVSRAGMSDPRAMDVVRLSESEKIHALALQSHAR